MVDLNRFSGIAQGFEDGVDLDIKDPVTGEPVGDWKDATGNIVSEDTPGAVFHPMRFRVASYRSKRVEKVGERHADKAAFEQSRNPRKVGTVAEHKARTKEVMGAVILGWSGVERDGAPLEYTPENVRWLLDSPDMFFVREQIDKTADNQALFIKA